MYMDGGEAGHASASDRCVYTPLDLEEVAEEMTDDELASDAELLGRASSQPPGTPRRRARGIMAASFGACGTAIGVLLLVVGVMPQFHSPLDASMENSMSKAFGAFGMMKTVVDGLSGVDRVAGMAKKAYPVIVSIGGPTSALRNETLVEGELTDEEVHELGSLKGKDLRPVNNKNNGNLCPDDEEMYATLCYKKCSKFPELEGRYPIRTSAFSCCASYPCTFFNSRFTNILNFCDGFDVAGEHAQGGCPHGPGDCYKNEEFSLGVCYKKCAIMTHNEFPYRAAADTCCRYNSHLACMDALNTYTNMSLNVGGGLGDGDNNTWAESHLPDLVLTEEKSHWTA